MWVTAHTGSATSATIVRGREGTTGVQHASTISWVHVATRADFELMGVTGDRPSGTGLPYKYQRYFDTTIGQPIQYDGTQWVQTAPEADLVSTSEGRSSATYGALATAGPAVTVLTGTKALVIVGCRFSPATLALQAAMSFSVSGATTLAAADAQAVHCQQPGGSGWADKFCAQVYLTTLTAGINTFTASYKGDGSNTMNFSERTISVHPIL